MPPVFSHGFGINANPGLTPASPEGALVLPGVYTLELTVDGKSSAQQVTVKNDPRSPAALRDAVTKATVGASAAEVAAATRVFLAKVDSAAQSGEGRPSPNAPATFNAVLTRNGMAAVISPAAGASGHC